MAIQTESIVLRVEGDTTSAVRATQKLADAQRQLKREVDGAAKAMSQIPATKTAGLLGTVGGAFKAAGIDAQTFGQGIKDIGKGLAFDAIRQQLKSLNSGLDSTAKSALSAGVNGAAMGAAFGGPWGAAIGGAAGAIKGLVTGLLDAESAAEKAKKAAEAEAAAYWENIRAAEKRRQVEAEMAPIKEKLAQYERELAERAELVNRVMNESPEAYRRASDAALAYSDRLYKVNFELRERLELEGKITPRKYQPDPYAGGGQTEDEAEAIRAARGLRDADLQLYAATKSYGDTLLSLERAENDRSDRMRDLEQILGDINVSQEVRNRALKEYNSVAQEAYQKNLAVAKSLAAIRAENEKAWAPIIEALNGPKRDPWASAKAEEARASMLAEHDISVENKLAELERQREPDLESDLRAFEAQERAKLDAANGRKSRLAQMFGSLDEFNAYKTAFAGLTGAVTAGMDAWITGSESAGTAIKKFLGSYLGGLAAQMAIEALKYEAYAVASLVPGPFFNPAAAAGYATTGAMFAGGAAAAAVAARALGGGVSTPSGGSGASSSFSGSGASSSFSGSGSAGGSGASAPTHTITNYYIVGDSFSEDSPRMRQRNAERVVEIGTQRTNAGRAE